jgi:hypothetical protein
MLDRILLSPRRRLFVCAGVLACLLVAAEPGRGSFPGTNGEIVAVGTGGLYTFDPDGTGARRILTSLRSDCDPWCAFSSDTDPSWSPDGTQIVFWHYFWFETGPMDNGIAIINADGSGFRWLVQGQYLSPHQPDWSPDGTRVVFVQEDGMFPGMISVVPTTSGGPPRTQLVRGSAPDWSPDGSRIAFAVGGQIRVIDPDGSNEMALTAGDDDTDPSWSPDGTRLAFVRHQHLWKMNADGSDQAQLLDTPGVGSPSWSPDGHKIAFAGDGTYTLDLATGTVARVLDAVQPDWGTHPIGKAQTISFAPLPDKRLGDPDFGLSATTSSGLAVSLSASGNCTVSGSTVHLAAAGSCTITASQPGDTAYYAAASVSQTFAIAKATQAITFGTLPAKAYGDPDFTLAATASSGLPVSFAASGTCTVNGANVHLTGAGPCTITASQGGNPTYEVATDVSRSLLIRCRVPNVVGKKLKAAKTAIASRGCRTGTVRHAYSHKLRKGRVSSQSRRARSLAPPHAKINLVVSRGRRH